MEVNKVEHRGLCQDYLYKKEAKGKWIQYWVVLDEKHLLFYESKDAKKLSGSIEISSSTKCVVKKRKTDSFPFTLCAARGRHLLKCESGQRRHRWMNAIQEASQRQRLSEKAVKTKPETDDLIIHDVLDSQSGDEKPDDVLPPNVVLVTSFPASSDSSSLPFRTRDKQNHSMDSAKDAHINSHQQSQVTVYPFGRSSPESTTLISDSEREQICALNLSTHSPLYAFTSARTMDSSSLSPRHRSFPSTPEKGVRPCAMSSQNLSSSLSGKSESLKLLTSSESIGSLTASNMLFSRHLVHGNDVGDTEV